MSAGYGPEILNFFFFKYFSKRPVILIVNKDILRKQMKLLKVKFVLNELFEDNIDEARTSKKIINFINVPIKLGKSIKDYIEDCFDLSLRIIKKNQNISLINGPINKEKFLKRKYLGITEYLGVKTNKLNEVVMLIYSKTLSVSPVTTHLPLKKVHKNLSKSKIINHANKINNFYKKNFKRKPMIAITGLNPHCESNFKDSEEKNLIIPAIKYLKKKKFNISGPYPTNFFKKNYINYVIIEYHDQVLTPIKSIFGFKAKISRLPFVRISPDHGLMKNVCKISSPES